MKIRDVVEGGKLNIISGNGGLDNECRGFYTSDILSDVIASAKEGSVWVTRQKHKNIMAVAVLKRLSAIILVDGCTPEECLVEVSEKECIPVLGTLDGAFEISGRLYIEFGRYE